MKLFPEVRDYRPRSDKSIMTRGCVNNIGVMRKEVKCNYCENRIQRNALEKNPGWIRINKLKPYNVAITGCPIHHDKVVNILIDWLRCANETDELELEGSLLNQKQTHETIAHVESAPRK